MFAENETKEIKRALSMGIDHEMSNFLKKCLRTEADMESDAGWKAEKQGSMKVKLYMGGV